MTWFPDDTTYYNDMLSQTGFSAAQWTAFMDTSVATTFGSLITDSLATIATTYSCYGGVNCTAIDLAAVQFGSAGVTMNPPVSDDTFLPVTNSVVGWGSAEWYPYNVTTMYPEFPRISEESTTATSVNIPADIAAKIGNSNITFYGLGSKYMCQTLMIGYYNANSTITDGF